MNVSCFTVNSAIYHLIIIPGILPSINLISKKEVELQRAYGYSIDEKLYKQLKCNQMKINVTNMTTTFPCPVNKLKGQLMDNIGLSWETEHGDSVSK